MWGFLTSVFSWIGGESIAASLTRVAIGIGLMRYLNKSNENASPTNSVSTPQGIRQQVPPATENKIPVVYGDAYLGGTIIDVQLVNDNKELYAVLVLCEETGDIFSSNVSTPASRTASSITIDNIYLNNNKITFKTDGTTMDYTTDDTGVQDTNGSGLLGIYLYKGGSDAPMLPCQSGTTTPIAGTLPPIAYEVMPGWGASHTCQNTIFAVIKMNYDPSKGLRSIPNLKFHVRNTLNKPGDVLHDYMTNQMYGGGVDEADIYATGITALNSYSDETVTYTGHAAQKRYVINGVIRTTETVMSNMQRIAGAAGSNVTYDISSGQWSVVVNKVTSKTLDFDDSNIIGQIAVTGTALDGYYNSVEVQFPYAYLRDQMNFTRIDLPSNLRNTNEPDNQLQITHDLVNNIVQAEILGNMDLRQSREDLAVTFNTDYSKFNVQVGDVVGLTNTAYGWTSKLFRVIRVKKNESESGRLTLEINAQQYNSDVYTVESISDFTPTIGPGHSIPNLGAIATPIAPTVNTGATISSQPSIQITGTVPQGVVTEMEFWYTPDDTEPNDNLRRYYLLGINRAENSGPFDVGATTTFKTVLLATDNYYFKVRAANQYGTSSFSSPTGPINYTYIQAPDVLPYQTPAVDQNGTPLEDQEGSGLNLGMLALYVASKLNWGGLWDDISSGNISSSTLGNLFGISGNSISSTTGTISTENGQIAAGANAATVANSAVSTANSAVSTANSAVTTANSAVSTASAASNTANQATAAAAAANAKAEAALGAIASLGGNVAALTETRTFPAAIMPNVYGPGAAPTTASKVGIYTHDHLVYAGSSISASEFKGSTNIVTNTTSLLASVAGKIHNFYNIDGSGSWARPPYYNQSLTDKYGYDSKVSLYYSTATYAGGSLDQQSWSAWTRVNTENGVTGSAAGTAYVCGYTNPEPVISYVADEDVENLSPNCSAYGDYDPNKANVAIMCQTTSDTRSKGLSVSTQGTVPFIPGTNKLIAFGVSVMNPPDGTAFSSNTLFGHQEDLTKVIDSFPFRQIASSGSVYVAINGTKDRLYYSSDATNWYEVTYDKITHNVNPNWVKTAEPNNALTNFTYLIHDGTKFLAYNLEGGVSTSTNGQAWTEYVGYPQLQADTYQVTAKNTSSYVAVGPSGIQMSTDGITWSAPSKTGVSNFNTLCCTYDGSNFLVGTDGTIGLWQSADGSTWSEVEYVSHPNYTTSVSAAGNQTAESFAVLQNKVEVRDLP